LLALGSKRRSKWEDKKVKSGERSLGRTPSHAPRERWITLRYKYLPGVNEKEPRGAVDIIAPNGKGGTS